MLYKKSELAEGLFFKVKSIRKYNNLNDLPENLRRLWIERFHHKYLSQHGNDVTFSSTYSLHADYVPEFSSVTEVSVGTISQATKKDPYIINVVDLTGKNEKALLEEMSKSLDLAPSAVIGGWNISNYQIPFVIKRMLINGVKLPFLLSIRGKKPWDLRAIDIMRDYQGNMFGDIDLELVALQFLKEYDANDITASYELKIAMEIALEMSS